MKQPRRREREQPGGRGDEGKSFQEKGWIY
jgi:hypothetical protein